MRRDHVFDGSLLKELPIVEQGEGSTYPAATKVNVKGGKSHEKPTRTWHAEANPKNYVQPLITPKEEKAMNGRHVLTLTVVAIVALGILAPVLSACAPAATPVPATPTVPPPAPTATPEKEVVLRYIGTDDKLGRGCDPALIDSTAQCIPNAYEQLVRYKPGTSEFEGVLATEWEANDDSTEWTLKLREGVKFYDGTPWNAQALKFSFDRAMGLAAFAAGQWGAVESVEVVDDHTVRVVMKRPLSYFPAVMAAPWGSSFWVSPKCVQEHATADDPWAKEYLIEHSCGTGPYQVEIWEWDDRIEMVKNPYYWRGWDIPHVDRLVLKFIPALETRKAVFEAGDADWWGGGYALPFAWIPDLLASPDNVVDIFESSPKIFTFYMNPQKPPLDNINVRKAIQHVFDWDKVNQLVWNGKARRAQGFFPRDLKCFDPSVPIYEYDIAKAKEYMAKAGYPDGGFTLRMHIDMKAVDWRQAVLVLQEGLEQIGITLHIESKEWATVYAEALQKPLEEPRPYHMTGMWFFPLVADPHEFVVKIWHGKMIGSEAGYNFHLWRNPELDALIDAGQMETDPEKRCEIYSRIQHTIQDGAVAITTWEEPATYVYKKWVKNPPAYTPFAMTQMVPNFSGVYIEGRPER
ncbi:MAG: ABC transporter substrate-binding protein [Chloroflexi bacterium]|nr:ABC transporter substrate-binding protein [Chloroflexota bacterium]